MASINKLEYVDVRSHMAEDMKERRYSVNTASKFKTNKQTNAIVPV